jgi:hypothetical protein
MDAKEVVGHVQQVVQRVLAQLHHHAHAWRFETRANERHHVRVVEFAVDCESHKQELVRPVAWFGMARLVTAPHD